MDVYTSTNHADIINPLVRHFNYHVNFIKQYGPFPNNTAADMNLVIMAFDYVDDYITDNGTTGYWEHAFMIQTGPMSLGVDDRGGNAGPDWDDIVANIVCLDLSVPSPDQVAELKKRRIEEVNPRRNLRPGETDKQRS